MRALNESDVTLTLEYFNNINFKTSPEAPLRSGDGLLCSFNDQLMN